MPKNRTKFYSTTEVAKLLGLSRIAVFKKVQSGVIKATKVGRTYVIAQADLPEVLQSSVSRARQREIQAVVGRVVKEYGETLRLLEQE